MTATAEQIELRTIDQATLVNLVRQALQNDDVSVGAWHASEMHGAGAGSHIYKVAGDAYADSTLVPWSFVLKIFDLNGAGLRQASADPAAWDYWKREWLACGAPWSQELRGNFVAPRCLGIGEQPGVAAWIAMENLSHADQRPWSLARFETVARHAGEFNGTFLAGRPFPTDPWLSQGWLRGWTERAEPMVALLPTVADHPLVRQVVSPTMLPLLIGLWEQRDAFFAALARLPQTLSHQDLFPRNVFVRPTEHGEQSVAIDWAFVGRAAIGEELAPLVGASLSFFEADAADADELERVCLQGYLEGLRNAGWNGDPDDVRFGYLGAEILRFGVGVLTPVLTILLDDKLHHMAETFMARPMDLIIRNMRAVMDFHEPRIAEAGRLLAAR